MVTAALFTMAKRSSDAWIDEENVLPKHTHTHTHTHNGTLLNHRKKEILAYTTTLINLEDGPQAHAEWNQSVTEDKYYIIPLIRYLQ